jgi:hypothetical protein
VLPERQLAPHRKRLLLPPATLKNTADPDVHLSRTRLAPKLNFFFLSTSDPVAFSQVRVVIINAVRCAMRCVFRSHCRCTHRHVRNLLVDQVPHARFTIIIIIIVVWVLHDLVQWFSAVLKMWRSASRTLRFAAARVHAPTLLALPIAVHRRHARCAGGD